MKSGSLAFQIKSLNSIIIDEPIIVKKVIPKKHCFAMVKERRKERKKVRYMASSFHFEPYRGTSQQLEFGFLKDASNILTRGRNLSRIKLLPSLSIH